MPTLATTRKVGAPRKGGDQEFVTHGPSIQAGKHSFASQDELNAYLVETMGAKPQPGGVGGFLSRKGSYVRHSADSTKTVTFGDPVLDTISSPAGTLVIGGKTINLAAERPAANPVHGVNGAGGGMVAYDAPALTMTGIVHDAERWIAADGSYVEYRIRNGLPRFPRLERELHDLRLRLLVDGAGNQRVEHARAIRGGQHPADDLVHERQCAMPDVRRRLGVRRERQLRRSDGLGIHAQQPERVAGVCQARWHHRNFADVVTAGDGCLRYKTDPWNLAFPTDWNPIVTVVNLNGAWTDGSRIAPISASRRTFSIDMSAFGRPTADGTITGPADIKATFPDDRSYTGQLTTPGTITWSNGSTWTKVIKTEFDLNGAWSDGSPMGRGHIRGIIHGAFR